MNWQTAAIYGVAAVVAVQGLFALMTAHRQAALRRFFDEEMRQREQAPREPQTGDAGPKANAA